MLLIEYNDKLFLNYSSQTIFILELNGLLNYKD